MDALLDSHGAAAPFSRVKLETRTAGSLKRHDLTILDRQGDVALTGEVKVPYAHDGASPFVESTVVDARKKAIAAHAPWFFTWNLNELVLWKTDSVSELGGDRGFKTYRVTDIHRREDLDSPHVQLAMRAGFETFLLDFIKIFTGAVEVQRRPPDDYFVHAFDSFLTVPILNARRALIDRDKTPAVRAALDQWMRNEQGWTLVGDRADLLGRAAKFAVYGVANKLVFYDALRKRFSGLPPLVIDDNVDTGDALIDKLATFFDTARAETGDYETIFGEAGGGIGTRIPFYDKLVVPGWRQFAEQIDRFDLSRLDYDVIGRIFERLIDPAERHKYGQYYTRPEVVDLINAFSIRKGDDVILDPGCGGGTFLVRAYARKRWLAPRLGHATLLKSVYGTDISPFAANLSTINLATRDLIEDANYPRVARTDFFDTATGMTLMKLPGPHGAEPVAMPRFARSSATRHTSGRRTLRTGKSSDIARLREPAGCMPTAGPTCTYISGVMPYRYCSTTAGWDFWRRVSGSMPSTDLRSSRFCSRISGSMRSWKAATNPGSSARASRPSRRWRRAIRTRKAATRISFASSSSTGRSPACWRMTARPAARWRRPKISAT